MGWEATWLDEGYVKVLAFVLDELVATDHILRTMK